MSRRLANIEVGQTFGRWTVLAYAGRQGASNNHHWFCKCQCGKERTVREGRLMDGDSVGCGCHNKGTGGGIVPGQRFGKLVAIEHKEQPQGRTLRRLAWLCRCDCGTEIFAQPSPLKNGLTRNCCGKGCTDRVTHGLQSHPLYYTWCGMKSRCLDQSDPAYRNYGGRGIKVCDRWINSVADFIADVGERPSKRHSLDRYPNGNGNYEPGNVRWATVKEQNDNRRITTWLEFRGETKTLGDWAKQFGMTSGAIYQRLVKGGLSVEEALTRPLLVRKARRSSGISEPSA